MSEDPSQMPYSDSNYCQIHMTTVSEGLYQRLSEKEVNFGILDMREQALLDFRMTNEADALFGVKERFVDPVTRKVKYMSDGLVRKIEKHLDMGAESKISNDLLYGWCSDVFCGNNGSERRIMFYGKDFGRQMAGGLDCSETVRGGQYRGRIRYHVPPYQHSGRRVVDETARPAERIRLFEGRHRC